MSVLTFAQILNTNKYFKLQLWSNQGNAFVYRYILFTYTCVPMHTLFLWQQLTAKPMVNIMLLHVRYWTGSIPVYSNNLSQLCLCHYWVAYYLTLLFCESVI